GNTRAGGLYSHPANGHGFDINKFQPQLLNKSSFLLHYFGECKSLKEKLMQCYLKYLACRLERYQKCILFLNLYTVLKKIFNTLIGKVTERKKENLNTNLT
uniref:Uncharacterized protein n=1 Tax=Equus asinus asinus TaxID=83772 RepID=A0A8C4LE64_EQUAS